MSQAAVDAKKAAALKSGPLNIVRDRWIYIGLSLLFLIPGTFFIISNCLNPDIQAPVRLGIDFTGGTMLEYGFHRPVTEVQLPQIKAIFEKKGYTGTVVQIQKPRVGINQSPTEIGQPAASDANNKTPDTKPAAVPSESTATPVGKDAQSPVVHLDKTPVSDSAAAAATQKSSGVATIVYIRSKHLSTADQQTLQQELTEKFGQMTLLQNFSIGPSLASELLKNGLLALLLAYILIVGYLTYRFEFDYAICAIVSLVHDALFVLGFFAILGHFFNTEVDSMFVTAILTVIGFSVHDTIVVYDRLRENSKIYFTKKLHFSEIANMSVNQTLARSISTSTTALLTLLALYFFGGETTKDFVLACIMGILVGTYSSIFVASALLTWWRERKTNPRQATA